jgi:chromosome segregation ATPase
MRPLPPALLISLLLALCSLCAWQWHRESLLREVTIQLQREASTFNAQLEELRQRAKAADAEILRLTGSLNELRTNSVSTQAHADLTQASIAMREGIGKQNAILKEQNESLLKQNAAVQQANETIKKLSAERDQLASRINEVTALYNKLAGAAKP